MTKREIRLDWIVELKKMDEATKSLENAHAKAVAFRDLAAEIGNAYSLAADQIIAKWEKIGASMQVEPAREAPSSSRGVRASPSFGQKAAEEIASGIKEPFDAATFAEKVNMMKTAIRELSAVTQESFGKVASHFQKTGLAAGEGGDVIRTAVREVGEEAKKAHKPIDTLSNALQKYSSQITQLKNQKAHIQIKSLMPIIQDLANTTGQSFDQVGRAIQNTFGVSREVVRTSVNVMENRLLGFRGMMIRTFGGGNIIAKFFETAFGTATALLIFQIQQMISQVFKDAMKNAKKFNEALNRMNAAEEYLSLQGVDISFRDLLDIVDKLDKRFAHLSKVDLTAIVAKFSDLLKQFKVTPEQIEKITEVALTLDVFDPNKELPEITEALISTFAKGRFDAIEGLGIQIDEVTVANRALKMGLAATSDELTQQDKFLASYQIVLEETAGKLADVDEVMKQDPFKVKQLESAWEDFTEEFGSAIYPIWTELALFTASVLETVEKATTTAKELLVIFLSGLTTLYVGANLLYREFQSLFSGDGFDLGRFSERLQMTTRTAFTELRDRFFPELRAELNDTETAIVELGEALEENLIDAETGDKIKKKLRDLAEELDAFGDKAREAKEDLARDLDILDADHFLKETRLIQDHLRDIEKVMQDYYDNLNKKQRKYHEDEIDREGKFLEKLRQLREKLLMDLEDALRERDARQVLRLKRKYEMDKENLTREHALEGEQRRRQFDDEIQDLQEQRDRRLAELKYEHELRLQRDEEDWQIRRKRKEEEHKIEMQRMDEQIQDRLRKLSNALADELKLDIDGANAIYDALSEIYGSGGALDRLYSYTYSSIISKANDAYLAILRYARLYEAVAQALQSSIGLPVPVVPATFPGGTRFPGGGTRLPGDNNNIPRNMARGGAVIANKPTKVTFGEAGAELATFIPLSKLGMPTSLSGAGMSGGGLVNIRLELSPDLEARIIGNSVDAVGIIMDEIGRR